MTKKEVEGKLEELQKAMGEGLASEDMILEDKNCRMVLKDTMNRDETF